MTAAAMLLMPWILRFMFGPRFMAAAHTAYLLILATLFWGTEQILEHGLRAANRPNLGMVSNLVGLVIVIALGIPGCVYFGIVGLGVAVRIAQFAIWAVWWAFYASRLNFPVPVFLAWAPASLHELVRVAPRLFRWRTVKS